MGKEDLTNKILEQALVSGPVISIEHKDKIVLTLEQQRQLLRDHLDLACNIGALINLIKNSEIPESCYEECKWLYRGLCLSYPADGYVNDSNLRSKIETNGLQSFSKNEDSVRQYENHLQGDTLPYIYVIIKIKDAKGLNVKKLAQHLGIYNESFYRGMLDGESEIIAEINGHYAIQATKVCNMTDATWETFRKEQMANMPKLNLFGVIANNS